MLISNKQKQSQWSECKPSIECGHTSVGTPHTSGCDSHNEQAPPLTSLSTSSLPCFRATCLCVSNAGSTNTCRCCRHAPSSLAPLWWQRGQTEMCWHSMWQFRKRGVGAPDTSTATCDGLAKQMTGNTGTLFCGRQHDHPINLAQMTRVAGMSHTHTPRSCLLHALATATLSRACCVEEAGFVQLISMFMLARCQQTSLPCDLVKMLTGPIHQSQHPLVCVL